MEKEKIILLFSDLEGTILRETDGEYSDEDMYLFLQQIDKLQEITGTRVKLHIVSPMYKKQVEEIVEKIDKSIHSYNLINNTHVEIDQIECAGAYPNSEKNYTEYERDKVILLQKPKDPKAYDSGRYGKSNYVRTWVALYKESEFKELLTCIYCGNGENDTDAMKYVEDREKGYTICPSNSREELKKFAKFKSEKTDLPGITEGLSRLNDLLKEKTDDNDEKSNKGDEER